MKKGTYLAGLLLLSALFILPTQAAVVSGGTEYLWGRAENGNVKISADRGCTYAELPGLAEEEARTGLSYDVALYPLEDGGIRVEGRDKWSTERSYQRDYSAAQVTQLLGLAQPTAKKALCTNGQVTVAVGYVEDHTNGDWTIANHYGWAESNNHDSFFYSTDGVTWTAAEQETTHSSAETGWWDGASFHAGYSTSADGIHWTHGEEYQESPELALSTELGPYHFEYDQETGEVYLMDRTAADTGVLLPHMGEAIRASMESLSMENSRAGSIRAWYGPNDTVYLAVYGVVGEKSLALIDYPISSLDWCLENLKTPFRTIEPMASDGDLSLGKVEWDFQLGWRGWTESRLACNDGSGWKWAENIPSGRKAEPLFCEGGYFWVLGEGHHLYRSSDGQTWILSDALRPADQASGSETYLNYAIAETATGFLAARHGGVAQHGMMGHSGGGWFEGYSKVYFLNKEFQPTGSYDFGRCVEAVGCLDGAYYAEVANSEGGRSGWPYYDEDGKEHEPKVFDSSLGSTLYRSSDGKTWEPLPDIYTHMEDIMVQSVSIGGRQGHFPTGDPDKPLRAVAQTGGFCFILKEDWMSFYQNGEEPDLTQKGIWVYLRGRNADLTLGLPEINRGILDHWIIPGSLTAQILPEGGIRLTVTDYSTPSMVYSHTYTPEDLLGRMAAEENFRWDTFAERYTGKPGVADLSLRSLPWGEKELLYRNETTEGAFRWYDRVPWSNSIDLLPFSSKDFMVYDPVNGKLWISADGLSWREAEGDWVRELAAPERLQNLVSLLWTGDCYMAVRFAFRETGKNTAEPWEDKETVYFLDEDLRILSSHMFETHTGISIGFRDGVYYVLGDDALFRSSDGQNWEKTDVMEIRMALRDLR